VVEMRLERQKGRRLERLRDRDPANRQQLRKALYREIVLLSLNPLSFAWS